MHCNGFALPALDAQDTWEAALLDSLPYVGGQLLPTRPCNFFVQQDSCEIIVVERKKLPKAFQFFGHNSIQERLPGGATVLASFGGTAVCSVCPLLTDEPGREVQCKGEGHTEALLLPLDAAVRTIVVNGQEARDLQEYLLGGLVESGQEAHHIMALHGCGGVGWVCIECDRRSVLHAPAQVAEAQENGNEICGGNEHEQGIVLIARTRLVVARQHGLLHDHTGASTERHEHLPHAPKHRRRVITNGGAWTLLLLH
mmetsp:Transcript_96390/g.223507  ORF Transcript_96390/g.223507 Transcript_96390/m.223507 type:complete len:256 (-) Transcript_96390:72-839(-)